MSHIITTFGDFKSETKSRNSVRYDSLHHDFHVQVGQELGVCRSLLVHYIKTFPIEGLTRETAGRTGLFSAENYRFDQCGKPRSYAAPKYVM